ncbi:MAG: tetratricopeptide repeat protein, partial [Candidatus Acidiferrum sp.]
NGAYTPGQFQTTNPNYPHPNPFYFEGKVDWNLLGITQPQNTWEFLQRGLHFQDDLGDIPSAINDYQTSLSMNSLQNNTCQITTAATFANGVPAQLTPAPCMFTVRLRLGFLLRESNPGTAIQLFQEVLQIDPQRLGVNTLIAETYVIEAKQASSGSPAQQQAYANAVSAYHAELALSPVTPQYTALTADQANNSKVHWELAEVYEATGQNALAVSELNSYLQATQWHSDVYPWRIALAKSKILTLQARVR